MNEYINFIKEMADESAKIILPYFHSNIEYETKEDHSPVTKADKEAEALLRKMIEAKFSDHGIIGEEYGKSKENSDFVWVLDPIDGTKSFICGVPLFGTLIALLHNNKPILGAINLPALNQLFIGANDHGTTLNDKPVFVKNTQNLSDATLLCTDHLDVIKHQNESKFVELAQKVKLYRNWGDCYMYALLAQGKVDIVMDPIMNFWDIQALIPIVREAGGIITDYQGNPPENANSTIASAPELHDQVIKMLNL